MDITFYMPVPKAATKKVRQQMIVDEYKHMRRPDLDNLAKFYLDALNGLVFSDDAQICELNLRKVYGMSPSVLIRIKPHYMNVPQEPIEDDDYLGLDFDY